MQQTVIVENIVKRYRTVEALRGVSFTADRGEIFGIIGPDGAGKTSLFHILTSLILPSSGTASVAGMDVVRDYKKLRRSIGYMPGKFSLYQDLTVEENLQFFATIFGTTIKENYHLIKDIYSQIEPFKHRMAGALSGGMKQKLALSCALIHKPEVLLLDEPTTGVDPVSRKELWEMLKKLRAQGITILVSTPYMDEASMCDRISLINDGKFLMINTPQNIVDSFDSDIYAVQTTAMSHMLTLLHQNIQLQSAFAFGDTIHVVPKAGYELPELRQYIDNQNIACNSIHPINASIEDCFIKLTAHESR